jgi:hypothetical protein
MFIGKGKVVPVLNILCSIKHHAMKMYLGSRSIAPQIINLSPRWRSVVCFTPLGKEPQVTIG